MSAFLVDKETIDRVITWVDYYTTSHEGDWFKEKMGEELGIYRWQEGWKDKLGQLMLDLNQQSLGIRYGDKAQSLNYTFYPRLCTPVQGLKSLQCWIYQCSEGEIPEQNKLYKFFDGFVVRYFMTRIIYGMKEYDQAQWA